MLSGAHGNAWAFECFQGAVIWEAKGRAGSAVEPLIVTHKRPETITESVFLGGPTLTVRDLVGGRDTWSDAAARPRGRRRRLGTTGERRRRRDRREGRHPGQARLRKDAGPRIRRGRTRSAAARTPRDPGPDRVGGPGGGKGVAAHSTTDGTRFWSWSTNSRGPWAMSGAENRVFLVNDGKITAMPSVG